LGHAGSAGSSGEADGGLSTGQNILTAVLGAAVVLFNTHALQGLRLRPFFANTHEKLPT